jgi:hypothetical protein
MNDVVWLSLEQNTPARGYWDQQLLEDIFIRKKHHDKIGKLKQAIVVIPTPYQNEDKINKELSKLDNCIVICTSDEENKFDLSKLKHDNMELYASYPHETDALVNWLPIGYTPHSKTTGYLEKDIDIYFAGQVNHESREDMVIELGKSDMFTLDKSNGFSQGLDKNDYIRKVRRTKVTPAPRGNISPDSFRLYEALEHGSYPVVENGAFWDKLFDIHPLAIITEIRHWKDYAEDGIRMYPEASNKVCAWWQRYKEDLFNEFNQDDITVVIPVSPIKSHPDTRILDETIKTIRSHLDCQIMITFDGVRAEQEDRREDYNLFINNVLSSGYDRIYPIIFEEHKHQSGMMREALEHIKTPLILYVEQDTPLTPDEAIDWDKCKQMLLDGAANLIRYHFEASIPEPHKHMMIGEPENGFLKTVQWSQRPHLATTAFYRRIINDYFSDNTNSFIEDNMHGVLHTAYLEDGIPGWHQFKTYIYHPEGNIKRSYHTDGREGESKWDTTQVF